MGLIAGLLGLGRTSQQLGTAIETAAGAFIPNATRNMELEHAAHGDALTQFGAEFLHPRRGAFDRAVDALNRMPRPLLALGTLGLFGYAMIDPDHFASRMAGLNLVPEPLWWLFGAIVSFYFGARELHHRRAQQSRTVAPPVAEPASRPATPPVNSSQDNAALRDWQAGTP